MAHLFFERIGFDALVQVKALFEEATRSLVLACAEVNDWRSLHLEGFVSEETWPHPTCVQVVNEGTVSARVALGEDWHQEIPGVTCLLSGNEWKFQVILRCQH